MKLFTKILFILVIFLKTGNLLSEDNLFNVNNISLEKRDNISNKMLANRAIEDAFNRLTKKVLLKEDIRKISDLNFNNIKKLVTYYNISKNPKGESDKVNFNVSFDKDKIHDLFFKRGISYSDITDKEFYILPILVVENEIFIFSNNYFHEKWNTVKSKDELIEFIIPLENIEIIQNVNQSRNNLINLELKSLFKEYSNKNVAIALIEKSKSDEEKIYLKARIQNKTLSKSLNLKKNTSDQTKLNEKIILEIKEEIINLIKSQNLIDVRTPSFLNVKFNLNKNKKTNLVLLGSKIKNIDSIDNIFVQEFNKDYVNLKIKYLGKLEKIINQLKNENISLQLINDQWYIKTL